MALFQLGFARATDFALDLGGAVEFYPAGHLLLRFDAGDTFLFTGARTFVFNGTAFRFPVVPRRDSLQVAIGFGWRF